MNAKTLKQVYSSPVIECVHLDNVISLILVSGSPGDPHTERNPAHQQSPPEFFNTNPIHIDVV